MSLAVSQENKAAALASKFINHTRRNIFLTGKAGTGKTTFLKHITRQTHKNTVVAAPTGIAAINAGGVTLHSLFHLPFGAFIPEKGHFNAIHLNSKFNNQSTLLKNLQFNSNKRKLLRELELLIIDEVSMLRSDLLDAVDTVLRSVRNEYTQPFGGVQVLFIGDLLQLPPVVKDDEWQVLRDHYSSPFFFDAKVLRYATPLYIELEKIYRQEDETFITILNNLRNNDFTDYDIEKLNEYYTPNFQSPKGENYIYLTTHNYKADKVNREELARLKEKSFTFEAEISGDFSEYAYPVEPKLELKKGAQVMFIKNDPTGEQKFFNGKIGRVGDIQYDKIEVEFEDDSDPVLVERYQWENVKYTLNEATNEIEEKVAGTFSHYPLKLAWAITVHKSQGLTFEKAIIDTSSAFAPGQVYVALSRLTSLQGLVLSSPINYRSIKSHSSVAEFSETKNSQEPLDDQLELDSIEYMKGFLLNTFNFDTIHHRLRLHVDSYTKDEKRSTKQKHLEWARKLVTDLELHIISAAKFRQQLQKIFSIKNIDLVLLQTRVLAAKEYYTPVFKEYTKNFFKQIEIVKAEKKVKGYLEELRELESLFFKQLQQIRKAEVLVQTAMENTEFTRQEILTEQEKQERIDQFGELKSSKKAKEKKPKKPKGASAEESFLMYVKGQTVEEIASVRGMALTTIEGHLAQFVRTGQLNVSAFVNEEKLEKIFKVIKSKNDTQLTPLKKELGDGYTYTDIRFAVAAFMAGKE